MKEFVYQPVVSRFFLCCQITASEVVIIVVVVTVAVCVQAGDFCHWAECILLLLLGAEGSMLTI